MIENLLKSCPSASILDLKMGISTVSARKRVKRNTIKALQKDQDTTTVQLGFRVTGYIIKDRLGMVKEKVVKPHGLVKKEHIPGILEKILC